MRKLSIPALCIAVLAIACGASGGPEQATANAPDGAALFTTYCALCHGPDGKRGLNGAKDLTLSILNREEMLLVVTNGRKMMQPYKEVLTPQEIEAVVDHLRSLVKKGA